MEDHVHWITSVGAQVLISGIWYKPSVEARILELRAKGDGILKIGRSLGIGTSVVQRVFKEVPWKRRSTAVGATK